MSVAERNRPKSGLIDGIHFFSMTKNLVDDDSFGSWIQKLFEFNSGMTIRYLRANHHRFTDPENRQIFNTLLLVNGLEKFQI